MKDRTDFETEVMLEVLGAHIVIFSSRLTDIRSLITQLEHNNLDYKEVRMGMGNEESRNYFNALRHLTDWPYLPQIFVNGKFVGGIDELLNHPLLEEKINHANSQ